jgi:hypothetical protein
MEQMRLYADITSALSQNRSEDEKFLADGAMQDGICLLLSLHDPVRSACNGSRFIPPHTAPEESRRRLRHRSGTRYHPELQPRSASQDRQLLATSCYAFFEDEVLPAFDQWSTVLGTCFSFLVC